jgi:two-component system cell cycle response regulator DivK
LSDMCRMSRDPILIVDDNPMNLKLARFLLTGEGYEVRTATNSEEALAELATFHPRLVLMDIQLPGMDGLALTRVLKSDPARRDIVILALTAYAMNGDEERARNAGCDGYITKPIDTRTLPSIVRRHLGDKPVIERATQPGDCHDLLAEIRSNFLVEAEEEAVQLLRTVEPGFDAQQAQRITHHWAGIAGTLGFSEIGRKARAIERSLEDAVTGGATLAEFRDGECLSRLRADLLGILEMLSAAVCGKRETHALPPAVKQALAGKTFTLVGFEQPEAARMSSALAQTQAYAHVLDRLPGAEVPWSADAFIVNVCHEPDLLPGMSAPALAGKPVLFIGSAEVLLQLQRDFSEHRCDFVLAPWDSEEIMLRLFRILAGEVAQALRPPPAARELAGGARKQPCVLIADDDPKVTALITVVLRRFGIECVSAHDGERALELAEELVPEVLILDVKMPELDGFGVLMSLKRNEITKGISVVMLTARDQDSDVIRGFGMGVDEYMKKPFNPVELAARVLRLLPSWAK